MSELGTGPFGFYLQTSLISTPPLLFVVQNKTMWNLRARTENQLQTWEVTTSPMIIWWWFGFFLFSVLEPTWETNVIKKRASVTSLPQAGGTFGFSSETGQTHMNVCPVSYPLSQLLSRKSNPLQVKGVSSLGFTFRRKMHESRSRVHIQLQNQEKQQRKISDSVLRTGASTSRQHQSPQQDKQSFPPHPTLYYASSRVVLQKECSEHSLP